MTEPAKKANQMGLTACISYVIGNVVGSGIFITPTSVLQHANSIGLSLVIWLISGLISIIGGIAYIELGTGIPTDGGDFAYANYVGWNGMAFAFMWVSALLTYPASTAVQATTFGQYVVTGLEQFVLVDENWRRFCEYSFGFALLFSCTFMNFFSIDKIAARFQIIVTLAKAAVLMTVICIGGYWFFFVDSSHFAAPFEGSNYNPGQLVMACYGGLWSYAGWDILNYGAPAIKNPKRNLPLSLMGGIISVTVIYVLTNASYFVVLSPATMLNSTAVAADFAQETMGAVAVTVPFATALLLMGTINANIFCTSRMMYEAARLGHLPRFLSAVNNKTSSPRPALVCQLIFSVIVSFVSVDTLINYVTFVMWAQKLVTMLALVKMRWQNTKMDDNVLRVPLWISIIFLIVCAALVVIPFVTDFQVTIIGTVFVFGGLCLYFLFVKPKKMPNFIEKTNDAMTHLACLVLFCDEPESVVRVRDADNGTVSTEEMQPMKPSSDEDEITNA